MNPVHTQEDRRVLLPSGEGGTGRRLVTEGGSGYHQEPLPTSTSPSLSGPPRGGHERSAASRLELGVGIDRLFVNEDLEVDMEFGSSGVPCVTDVADDLAGFDPTGRTETVQV